jgi:Fe-S-cluster containining protein
MTSDSGNSQSSPSNPVPEASPKLMDWSEILGVPKPQTCNLKAACCSVATPSVPADDLLRLAVEGDETCRDFLSVFIPHLTHQAAKDFYREAPEHVDRVLSIVRKRQTKAVLEEKDVVFYHCRFLDGERRCQIYEDRPAFCRDYPASPMSILIKGCGYVPWVEACKEKLGQLGYEIVEALD